MFRKIYRINYISSWGDTKFDYIKARNAASAVYEFYQNHSFVAEIVDIEEIDKDYKLKK